MDIIISNNTAQPIYEQITNQIKKMVMNGELKAGTPLPSMRSLAKSLHISVITVQRAYDDLQKDGFIESTIGRGSFITDQDRTFYQEEQQKIIEDYILKAVEIAKTNNIKPGKLIELINIFYLEELPV